jgi:hypothetical protein
MASHTDHIRRDAEHAARNEISTCIGKFTRRMNEAAKATVAAQLAALDSGEVEVVLNFDTGTEMGRAAAAAAITEYLFDNPEQVTPRPGLPKAT